MPFTSLSARHHDLTPSPFPPTTPAAAPPFPRSRAPDPVYPTVRAAGEGERGRGAVREYAFEDALHATEGFKALAGRGPFGFVYKGFMWAHAARTPGEGAEGEGAEGVGARALIPVAVKVLNGDPVTGVGGLATFAHECALVEEEGRHASLLRVHGYVAQRPPIIICDFIEGGTVEQLMGRVARGEVQFGWRERVQMAFSCADVLAQLHRLNLVHRNFKASNVLLQPDGTPVVADYGLARVVADWKMHVQMRGASSMSYIDPAYFDSGTLTRLSDTYAFGIFLLELVSGASAQGPRFKAVRKAVAVAREADPSQVLDPVLAGQWQPAASAIVLATIRSAIVYERDNRPDMAIVRDQLRRVLDMIAHAIMPHSAHAIMLHSAHAIMPHSAHSIMPHSAHAIMPHSAHAIMPHIATRVVLYCPILFPMVALSVDHLCPVLPSPFLGAPPHVFALAPRCWMAGDAEGGIEMTNSMQMLRQYCLMFASQGPPPSSVRLFFPDANELPAAQEVFEGTAFPLDCLTKPTGLEDIGFSRKLPLAHRVATSDRLFVAAYPYFNVNEMLAVDDLYRDVASKNGQPIIVFNGELDRIRSGYYPSFFYPKLAKINKSLLPLFEAAYYIHNFKGRFGGKLFRAYPGPWQVVSTQPWRPNEASTPIVDGGTTTGAKFRVTLGLPVGAVLNCADNTGAKNLFIMSVCGIKGRLNRLPSGAVGDMVMATVKKGKPDLRKKVLPAVIVRQRKPWRRKDGVFMYFEDNAGVIVNPKGEMKAPPTPSSRPLRHRGRRKLRAAGPDCYADVTHMTTPHVAAFPHPCHMPAPRFRRAPIRAPLLWALCLVCLARFLPVAPVAGHSSPALSSPSQLSPTLARRRLTQSPAPDPPSQSLAPSPVAEWAAGEGWERDTWRDLSGEFGEEEDEGGEGSSRRGNEDWTEQAQGKRAEEGIGGKAGLGGAEQGTAGEAGEAGGGAAQNAGKGGRGGGAAAPESSAGAAEGASWGRRAWEGEGAEGEAWQVEEAWREWDRVVGCERFRAKHAGHSSSSGGSSFQGEEASDCSLLKLPHVTVQIMASASLPAWLEGFFACPCGLTCTLSRSEVLAARPDAMLYEGGAPRGVRVKGDPLLVHVDMEAEGEGGEGEEGAQGGSGVDVTVGYGPGADVQCSYASNLLLADHNPLVAASKSPALTIFHASSRYSPWRAAAAPLLLAHPLTHRFGLQTPLPLRRSLRRAFPHCQYSRAPKAARAQGAAVAKGTAAVGEGGRGSAAVQGKVEGKEGQGKEGQGEKKQGEGSAGGAEEGAGWTARDREMAGVDEAVGGGGGGGARGGPYAGWWGELACVQSHFLFSLAIERHPRPSYVTEKFFLPLLAGSRPTPLQLSHPHTMHPLTGYTCSSECVLAHMHTPLCVRTPRHPHLFREAMARSVPIYYGAADVREFAPPESFMEGGVESQESIVQRVHAMRTNTTEYLSLHAWRRCGVLGGLQRALQTGFDTLPCRLCHRISAMGGRAHTPQPRSAEEDAAAGGGDAGAMNSGATVI
ncbi:unnamed protein product [Closterium sp. Yama58-4]|nr:unnamed protein product [Closterium sp. Yama58-4]